MSQALIALVILVGTVGIISLLSLWPYLKGIAGLSCKKKVKTARGKKSGS